MSYCDVNKIILRIEILKNDNGCLHPKTGCPESFSPTNEMIPHQAKSQYFCKIKSKKSFNKIQHEILLPVGARVDSSLDLDVYAANLAYNFIHSKRARFGVGAGVHAANFENC
jgi:hypothetical protein